MLERRRKKPANYGYLGILPAGNRWQPPPKFDRQPPPHFNKPGSTSSSHIHSFPTSSNSISSTFKSNKSNFHSPSVKPKKKLFSELFKEEGISALGTKENHYNGKPSVSFSLDEESKLAGRLEFALVGRSSSILNLEDVKNFLLGIGFKGGFRIRRLNQKDSLFIFNSEEDYFRFFFRGTWFINNIKLYVMKWTPDYSSSKDCPIVPVWVTLGYIPVHFMHYSALFTIASSIGNPILMDFQTSHLIRTKEARCCIEIDVSKPLPDQIHVRIGPRDLLINCSFEKSPGYCNKCFKLGPSVNFCKKHIIEKEPVLKGKQSIGPDVQDDGKWVFVNSKKAAGKKVKFSVRPTISKTGGRKFSKGNDGWILASKAKKCQATHSPFGDRHDGRTLDSQSKRIQATHIYPYMQWVPTQNPSGCIQIATVPADLLIGPSQQTSMPPAQHVEPQTASCSSLQIPPQGNSQITGQASGIESQADTTPLIDIPSTPDMSISSATSGQKENSKCIFNTSPNTSGQLHTCRLLERNPAGSKPNDGYYDSPSSRWSIRCLLQPKEHFPSLSAAKSFASKIFNISPEEQGLVNSNTSLSPTLLGSKDDCFIPEACFHSEGDPDPIIWVNSDLLPIELPGSSSSVSRIRTPKALKKKKKTPVRSVATRSQARGIGGIHQKEL